MGVEWAARWASLNGDARPPPRPPLPSPPMAAPSAPPVEAPTMPQETREGSDGSEVGAGPPDAPRALRKARRGSRLAQRSPAPDVLIPATDVASRAGAVALIAMDCAGTDAQPPLPLAVACRLRGIPLRTVEEALARCDPAYAALEAARAAGVARCLRMSMSDPANGRNWWQLAERLEPKTLHLPTKVHTGQDPDAAPIQVQPVLPATPQAIRAELLAVQGEIARALKAGDGEEP